MKNKKILIADDQEGIRMIIKSILKREPNTEIFEAGDTDEVLNLANTLHPDLILLDINMPGKFNGINVCKEIRNNKNLRFTKLVFISGNVSENDVREGFESGGDDYIKKPFSPGELLARVRVQLRLKYEEEINDFKDTLLRDFNNFMSHELRTPLSGIIGFSSLVMESNLPVDLKNYIKMILISGKRIEDLAEKTLLFIKLKNTRSLNIREISFLEECEVESMLFKSLEDRLSEKQIILDKDFTLSALNANCFLIGKGLLYLVEHLIDFSKKESIIKIESHIGAEFSEIAISNDNVFYESDLDSIFEFLENLDMPHYHEGGLDLPIVKEIMTLHRGTVRAEKYGLSGIKFVLSLPN